MCEVCSKFSQLLITCEARLTADVSQYPTLKKSEVEVVLAYILSWPQRQCMCCYRDLKNFDRFNLVVQSILYLSVCQLKALKNEIVTSSSLQKKATVKNETVTETSVSEEKEIEVKDTPGSSETCKDTAVANSSKSNTLTTEINNDNSVDGDSLNSEGSEENETWTMQQKEKLMHIVSKIFLLNFPLYIACKHSSFSRLDDLTAQEITSLSCYCDLHDTEIPVYLLRNVNLFCKSGGICAMTSVFESATPENLPVSMAHSIVAAIGDIKLWLNYRAITQFFLPLRSKVLKYMCNLEDKDLRLAGVKTMADFMWGTVKDPLDTPVAFDGDGLDLAFKYFSSSTLTMRLAGITQINTQISLFNEICASEPVPEAETVGQQLAQWLCSNQIMQHLFGPNLHVEVIKQAHIILKFLAVENRITNEHVDLIWQAAQLKHCSKQVYDLLPGFIKNLAPIPCSHLYQLLCTLPLREHTEQSLYLASALMRVMWSRSSQAASLLVSGVGVSDGCTIQPAISVHPPSCSLIHRDSSSEASVSMDPTNSDEDPCEELSTSGEEAGPTPRKQSKHQSLNPVEEQKWTEENCQAKVAEISKPCQKRSKNDGASSGSVSSGIEDLRHPPKKKVLRRRKNIRRDLFANIAKVELGELIESISDAEETSGSEPEVCAISKNISIRNRTISRELVEPAVPLSKQGDRSPDRDCAQATIHDCPTLCDSMDDRQLMELLSGDDGEASISSAMSNKSDKNMADFDGEESGCEEELASLAAQAQCMGGYRVGASLGGMIEPGYTGMEIRGLQPESICARGHTLGVVDCFSSNADHHQTSDGQALHFNLKIKDVCKPGNTLLWDLLQDHNIKQLGEGLALEAEKALYTLLGYNTDKFIRFKFIEGCLDNLANHTSVSVSLRLLPKLFSSFQIRGLDMHQVVLWAEREHRMMELFFNDLKHYITNCDNTFPSKPISEQSTNTLIQTNLLLAQSGLISPLFSHITEISVRLQFLTTIFSPMGSPTNFRLTLEQVDTLWNCLANDPECSDCLFSWLSSHTKSTDQHALSIDALKYLYIEKMPTLNPETISIMGLSFYQQLCSLARMTLGQAAIDTKDQSHPHVLAVDHLWKIALKARNTDVSMGSIQYLNSYYMNQHLQQEEDFLSKCMSHLSAAAEGLKPSPEKETEATSKVVDNNDGDPSTSNLKMSFQNISECSTEEASLQCIQRALLLLKTHLDTFKRRYAYHVRRWAQSGASVCGSSVEGSPLRVIIQPGGINVKATLDMHNTDYIADLRAQVTIWWEQQAQCDDGMASQINDGPIRMLTQGQELTFDFDEKTLYEMGFKDNQLVFLSVGGAKSSRSGGSTWGDVPSQQPPPPRTMLPTLLLLKPQYFDRLFDLMQTLGEMTMPGSKGERVAHMKAQLLSRRVWDILHAVPLSPVLLEAFENPKEAQLPELLNPSSPQHLMYSLHIVDKLSGASEHITPSPKRSYKSVSENIGQCNSNSNLATPWSQLFIKNGGLRHLYDILMSGVLQSEDGDDNEWQQDCLVLLLKLIGHLGIAFNSSKENQSNTKSCDILTVPRLHESLLSLMDIEGTTRCLMNILSEASRPKDPSIFKTGLWGRAQVVQHCMGLLVCWAHSSSAAATQVVCSQTVHHWLPRLLLEDPQPQVRRETCSALYRLCLGSSGNAALNNSASSNHAHHVIPTVIQQLLDHLPRAEGMRPCKIESVHHHPTEEGKEPYGPACRDYFWLICRLVDVLPSELIKENGLVESIGLDLNTLCQHLTDSLCCREIIERREDPSIPDDGLFGQLNLLTHLVKHPLPFKNSEGGKKLLEVVFGFLFDVANPSARLLPKCKSQKSRAAAYDLLIELVKGCPENYMLLHHKLLEHHQPGVQSPYPWDYWPAEEGRSECGYVGLTNLGATCYMASCMQHLYMMPQARSSILKADPTKSKHQSTLVEMQKMFAYLLESERKSYNPRNFCKVYQMDHQPLNTGEQKDMAEFFIDLVSKLEEMTPELKTLVKTLFCGVLSNNVVSLDCNHVSRTLEEFYTVRCQVADMRNLYQSLDEVTVKDTLEGDNCYTCSQCSTKVRAEKRACFKKLPRILCFNTMRYTFNMVTMLKEKVNTHFSFPMKLDMSEYVEKHLMPAHYKEEKRKSEQKRDNEDDASTPDCGDFNENYEYELIGVTVHTGTADGGHYYSFIKERNGSNAGISLPSFTYGGSREKWLLFNDAEVKPFDPAQIASECFGGEMTSKTYDSATDKFMDFCFEKTNSAYMLFYERGSPLPSQDTSLQQLPTVQASTTDMADQRTELKINEIPSIVLSPTLQVWIWEDNMNFLHQKNIFQHAYFTFMGQMCSYIPQSLLSLHPEITEIAAQLSTSFFIETFIHAKEKPTMVSWVELVTKQFNASALASEWFLGHMASNTWWPMQVLIKCPNQMVRQMFQRLSIHVIQRLRSSHCALYSQEYSDNNECKKEVGEISCITRFIKMLLSLMENGAKAHLRHLTEYFSLLFEFSKMGEEESQFLLKANAISMMVSFYLGHTSTSTVDGSSSDDGGGDKLKPAALDKMIALVAGLVERSRDPHKCLNLTTKDQQALQGGKGFPFLYQQTRDCLNLQQTKMLIHAMCRWNDRLAQHIISMIFQAISKHTESCQPFFKLLTLLVEGSSGASSGLPCFTQLALQQVWDAAESCPHATIEWLASQVPRNKMVHSWVLQTADSWIETYLMAHTNQRVRSVAAFLLISLVPSLHFRQGYRTNMRCMTANKDVTLGEDAYVLLHQVYTLLLGKLKAAKKYIDIPTHGILKLTAYFSVLSYCLVSRMEKIMFGQYFRDLWELFHPGLSEPSVSVLPNKQALLAFWHSACIDCPENIQLIISNATISKHIAFNYILADHNDCEVVSFNRAMLPSYYAILRLCCQCSPSFTRTLSQHQNIHWAFKNITSHPNLYAAAIDELFRLMQLFAARTGDASEQELREVNSFRRSTLTAYLQGLNGKTCWTTLISAFRTLVDTDEDRLYIVYNGGLQLAFEAFHTLHTMYHEAGGAAGATGDLCELLALAGALCRSLRSCHDCKEARAALHACKDWPEALRRLATLLNTYNPPDIRNLSIALIKELLPLLDCIALAVLVPLLLHCHSAFQDACNALPPGPYFPVRNNVGANSDKAIQQTRPLRPMVQMCVPHVQLQARKGVDPEYDNALCAFYLPYHSLLDAMCRLGVEKGFCSPQLVSLSTMAACEAAPLQFTLFPTFWHEIFISEDDTHKYSSMLLECKNLVDYMDLVLMDERETLINDNVYQFFLEYFSKVDGCKVVKSVGCLIAELESKVEETTVNKHILLGDVRTLEVLIPHAKISQKEEMFATLKTSLKKLLGKMETALNEEQATAETTKDAEEASKTAATESESPTEVEIEKLSEGSDVMSVGEREGDMPSSSSSPTLRFSYVKLNLLITAINNLMRIVDDSI